MRVFVYADSPAMVPAAVAIGNALQSQLNAVIVLLVVNAGRTREQIPSSFEVLDFAEASVATTPASFWKRMRIRAFRAVLLVTFLPFVLWELQKGHDKTKALDDVHMSLSACLGIARGYAARLPFVRDARWILALRESRRFVRGLLANHSPDLLVTFEDNIETLTRVFVAEAKERGVATLIVPYTIPNPLEPLTALASSPAHQATSMRTWLLKRFPTEWRWSFEGRALLRLPVLRALAVELMGLAAPRPWVLNSGSADAIGLDSEAARRGYLALGFEASKLRVIGDPVGAELDRGLGQRDALRARLCASEGFPDQTRPLIVCAFPPDQYRGTDTSRFESPTFERLMESWMLTLRLMGERGNVLVRPHPRLDPARLRAWEGDTVRISLLPTAEIVPAADLYVASISATIRWAIACGIPVINYDCYRYRYDDYKDASGVVTVETEAAFREAALRFLNDEAFARDWRGRQEAVMAAWGLLDQRFGQRLADLAASLAWPGGKAPEARTL